MELPDRPWKGLAMKVARAPTLRARAQRVAVDRAAERPCGRIEQEELDLHPDLGAVAQFGQAFDDPT